MFLVTRNPKYYLLSLAVSVGIFLILYFTVIRPDHNSANNAIRQAGQQAQQLENQVATQANQAASQGSQAASQGSQAASTTASSVSSTVNKAENYASCVTAAGTDTTKLEACATKFSH